MASAQSCVTVHMAASLDGFIARPDGAVDWMATGDRFDDGVTLDPTYVQDFLASIDAYVMGSKTYELALSFEERGFGWSYGDKPTYVLTTRNLPQRRESIAFRSGDVAALIADELRPRHANIWIVGGGQLVGECVQRDLVDEVRVTLTPVLIGTGIPFFAGLARDVSLHLVEAKAYTSGMVALRHEVRR